MSVEIEGADQLAKLARQLKEAGDKGLQRELSKAINRAVKPVKAAMQESARTTLPKGGGLADAVAKSKFRTRRANSARASGVRVIAKSPYNVHRMNDGQVWHPGGTLQEIRPGWWDTPTEKLAPGVRAELVKAMDEVAKQIGRAP